MSSTLAGPRHVLQWPSKFARKSVKRSLGGEVRALSEKVDQMSLLRDFSEPFEGLNPGTIGLEDYENLFAHLITKKMIAKKYSARHFLSIRQALGAGELDNVNWAPGTENPADGLTKVRSDMAPPLRELESGHFNSESFRPLNGVAWEGGEGPLSPWGSRACMRTHGSWNTTRCSAD